MQPSAQLFASISKAIEKTQDAIGIYNSDDVLTYCNQPYAELFACEQSAIGTIFDQLITHCWESKRGVLIETENIEQWLMMAATKRRKRPFRSFEIDLVDGRWFKITELMVDDELFIYATDVTESKRTEIELLKTKEKLTEAASTDFLTNVYNRRHFSYLAKNEIERCDRSSQHVALVLLDIDHFKRINDQYGHAAGDKVLCELTERISKCLRGYDIFTRVGGEEFAILLPETTSAEANNIASRYLRKISNTPFMFEQQALKVTVSIGISESYLENRNLDLMLKSADENLYIAKQTGRNKVVAPVLLS